MQHTKDYQRIDDILEQFRTAGGLKHEYQAYKLFSLWQLLLAERPQRILELGSGTSTAVFADYVRLSGGQLWSIDENDNRFHLLYAEKRVERSNGHPVEIGYNINLANESFDLVLIDGPSLRVNGERYKNAVNPDIFAIVDRVLPKLILVDIRAATVNAISHRLSDLYRCELSDIIRGMVKSDYRYFTEFHIKP